MTVDDAAFEELYADVAPALYAWARLRLRGALRARVEPEELLQEVWIRSLERLDALGSDTGAFRPFVFGVAKNVLLEALRRLGREGGADDAPPAARGRARRGHRDHAPRDDALARFLEQVEELDEGDRQLVAFVGLEGLTFAEAGARLDLTRDAAAKRWQRLRTRLAEWSAPRELFVEP